MKRSAIDQLTPSSAPPLQPSSASPLPTQTTPLSSIERIFLESNEDGQLAINYSTPQSFGSHPFGIQPEGNSYFSEHKNLRPTGLGLLATFEDEWLVDNLFSFFDEATLLKLASCSKALYGLIMGFDVEIWKERAVEISKGDYIYQWRWQKTWQIEYQLRNPIDPSRASIPVEYINMYNKYPTKETLDEYVKEQRQLYKQTNLSDTFHAISIPSSHNNTANQFNNDAITLMPNGKSIHPEPYRFATTYPPQLLHIYPTRESTFPKVSCKGFFSDAIFQPWMTIKQFHERKDTWVRERNIERIDINTLSVDDFNDIYSTPGKPVVLLNVLNDWPATKDKEWTIDSLLGPDYSRNELTYTCGIADLTMDKYLLYASRCDDDDTPIYLFDKQFGEKNPHIPKQYKYPLHFEEDYFGHLRHHQRPSFRWFIVGPERSGSSFHMDPLLTQASNNLFIGKKLWILYPPHIVPPGIMASDDGLQVTAPFNVSEWFQSFYKQTMLHPTSVLNKPEAEPVVLSDQPGDTIEYDHITDYPRKCQDYTQYEPVQIIQRPGETVFIPATWWHSVINLEFGIAVTQNQVNQGNFIACEKFLKKIDQESIRLDLLESVEVRYPGLRDRLDEIQHKRYQLLQRYYQKVQGRQPENNNIITDNDTKFHHVKKDLLDIFNKPSCASNRDTNDDDEGFSFGFDFE